MLHRDTTAKCQRYDNGDANCQTVGEFVYVFWRSSRNVLQFVDRLWITRELLDRIQPQIKRISTGKIIEKSNKINNNSKMGKVENISFRFAVSATIQFHTLLGNQSNARLWSSSSQSSSIWMISYWFWTIHSTWTILNFRYSFPGRDFLVLRVLRLYHSSAEYLHITSNILVILTVPTVIIRYYVYSFALYLQLFQLACHWCYRPYLPSFCSRRCKSIVRGWHRHNWIRFWAVTWDHGCSYSHWP